MGVFSEWFGDSCTVCGASARGICQACVHRLSTAQVPPLLGIDQATVLCSYEAVGAKVVQAIKYQNRRQGLGTLVTALAMSLWGEFDAIVAVPAQRARLRKRGYDIPQLMAKQLSRQLDVPVLQPLVRIDDGSQRSRGRLERRAVQFRAMSRVPERILLVDDVLTTGATAVACAAALRLAGAHNIAFVALASTPPKTAYEQRANDAAASICK